SPEVTIRPVCTRADNLALTAPYPVGTTKITCVATDSQGNTDTCSFNVIVKDCEAPTITCPADITVNNDQGKCGAVVRFSVPLSDNCPGFREVCDHSSGDFFPVGTTTVTCRAIDAAGNLATCSLQITVTGITGPLSIQCPADIPLSVSEVAKGANITFSVTATPGATVVCTDETGKVVHSGDFFS